MNPHIHDMWLRLKETAFLSDLNGDLKGFAAEAGIALGQINHIHPFREGNGRAQREYLDALARRAGFMLECGGVSKLAMKNACVDAVKGPECKALAKFIRLSAKKL
ncbi:Fic family protein [Pseudomonas sp. NKUCC02_KPG]|uniref:Fic family protein n=1 Tax=Pseudomonas sp. NKUCC02_KPG TaxID=2842124 RepID=UPI00214BADD9|nr:Fic family protein [Pseudomonas sp. NKUCC02_KPG]